MQRYFAKEIVNDNIILYESDMHHIKNVMRMKENDMVEVIFDKKLYLCILDNNYNLIINNVINENNEFDKEIIALIGLTKEQKMDLILQKLTELGVSKIIPVNMERSIVKLDDKRLDKKMIRWETICKEASEQSKRTNIPIIHNVINLKDLSKIEGDIKLVASTSEKDKLLNCYLQNVDNCAKIVVVIGPEGGISDKEENYLINNGYNPVSFGNLIFRVETACIYVASILNYYSSRGV